MQSGQPVLHIAERCLFRLTKSGLETIEIAPGIDLEKDILRWLGFRPLVANDLKTMERRLFFPGMYYGAAKNIGVKLTGRVVRYKS